MYLLRSVLVLLLVAAPLGAQQPRQVTTADYARAERFLGATAVPLVDGLASSLTWRRDGKLWYRTSTPGGTEFIVVDVESASREAMFDRTQLAGALTAATGGAISAAALLFRSLDLSKDGRTITVQAENRRWECDLQRYRCTAAPAAPAAAPPNSIVSPDGSRAVFIRDYNLWVTELATGRETQLTADGEEDFGYATNNAGWTHSDRPVVTWSPDSRKIATFQHDGRGVPEMYLVSTNVGSPKLEAWKYPLPGDSVIFRIHRVIIDVAGAAPPEVVRLQMPPDAHRSTVTDHIACSGGTVCDLQWYPDGSHIAFVSSSRDHQTAWFRIADTSTGEVQTIFEEQSQTQIGDASLSEDLWRVLPATNELIWWSHRDGGLDLYLHDLDTGRLENRITSGNGNVQDVLRVDERTRTIFFTATGFEQGRDPYFEGLYRIGFDGRDRTLLTPEDAHHDIEFSPDGRYFADTYSTPATPPVTVLRRANGELVDTLERADLSRLVATGWKPPAPITVKARDGTTDLYGLMFTPTMLDSTRRYPVIDYIYPGPQSGSVGSRAFSPARRDHQALAELGFIVIAIDGMGTPGRSKEFADAYYGRMADNTLPDQVAAIRQLAERYSFIDGERVGIWGHSGGGFAAAAAMFDYPEVFDVGISESGNHDNRNYEDDWGERYQGLLVRSGDSDNYAAQANQTRAANLEGKLFLIHGMMDDNVPPYNTLLVVDALVKANKDFDLLMLPQARHGFGQDSDYVMRRRWDYFVKHLLGAEPPDDYQIGG